MAKDRNKWGEFSKGNEFWRLRKQHGQPKAIKSAEELLKLANEYFEECDKSPWLVLHPVKAGPNMGETVAVPTARPYTEQALVVYLNIAWSTWDSYKKSADYSEVCSIIVNIIKSQQIEGALVGAFKEQLTARLNNISDKQEVTIHQEQPLFAPLSKNGKPNKELISDN